jgi:hypothetical protein
MKTCKIKNCDNKHHARGWCSKHYTRWKKYGDPKTTLREMHGYWNHSLYQVWCDMKQRCYNKKIKSYENYGGRGITVCNEWKNSAKAFIEWALPLWREDLLIDRIDNDGNYEPSNCRFITYTESNHNKRLLMDTNTSKYK